MAYCVYVENTSGKPVITFSEGYSRRLVNSLLEMQRKGGIKSKSGRCHLEEIYKLDRTIAIPLLLNEVENLRQELKPYLDEPKGRCEWQKDLFKSYGKAIEVLENLPDKRLVFRVWDMS